MADAHVLVLTLVCSLIPTGLAFCRVLTPSIRRCRQFLNVAVIGGDI